MKSFFEKFKIKKILIVTGWISVIAGLFTSLAFVNRQEQIIKSKGIKIEIEEANNNLFVDPIDIKEFLNSRNDFSENRKLSEIDINKIEKSLLTHPAILSAQVSLSIDGILKITIKQREPLVRVFNLSGESFYLDKNANLMPLSENYTARVPVANGFIWETLDSYKKYNYNDVYKNKQLNSLFTLDDLFQISNFISKDTLLNSLVQQIYINQKKEFEFLPAIGEQKIIFGKCENIENKFEKLKVFYKEGLNSIDGWNDYTLIDLRFEGQVVCKKKYPESLDKKLIETEPKKETLKTEVKIDSSRIGSINDFKKLQEIKSDSLSNKKNTDQKKAKESSKNTGEKPKKPEIKNETDKKKNSDKSKKTEKEKASSQKKPQKNQSQDQKIKNKS